MVKDLKGNRKILASCGEIESSILADLLIVLKKYPKSEFNCYIIRFQNKYDDGTNIDRDNLMREIVITYESLVEDGQWDTIFLKKLRSLLSLARFKKSISYLLNN